MSSSPMGQLLIAEVEAGRLNYIQQYIDDGAPLDEKDNKGRTALMYAALNNDAPIVKMLLNAGADATLRDNYGNDALANTLEIVRDMDAALEITDSLLSHEPYINPAYSNNDGYSAEYYASRLPDARIRSLITKFITSPKGNVIAPAARLKKEEPKKIDMGKHRNLRRFVRRP